MSYIAVAMVKTKPLKLLAGLQQIGTSVCSSSLKLDGVVRGLMDDKINVF